MGAKHITCGKERPETHAGIVGDRLNFRSTYPAALRPFVTREQREAGSRITVLSG